MKNAMPTRKSIGKTSSFLKGLKSKKPSFSEIRRSVRQNTYWPNSVKVGAGSSVVARRRLPQEILHKRNHRTNIIVGFN